MTENACRESDPDDPESLIFPRAYLEGIPPIVWGQSPIADVLAKDDSPALRRLVATLDAWVTVMPQDAKDIAINRLRGADNAQHMATQYEVLLYGYFRAQGYSVTPNVPICGGGELDLLIERDGCRAYVEIFAAGAALTGAERRAEQDRILQALRDVAPPDFQSLVTFDQEAPLTGLTLNQLRQVVRAHLKNLREDRLEPGEPLRIGGNLVYFERQPAPAGAGASAWRPHVYEYPAAIHRRLDQKLQRFAPLKDAGVPYIVAICDAMLERPLNGAVEEVLFRGSAQHRPYFAAGHTRLSAVLTCEKHNFDEGVELDLRLYHNPNAANPVALDCLPDIPQVRATLVADSFNIEAMGPEDGRTWLRAPSAGPAQVMCGGAASDA